MENMIRAGFAGPLYPVNPKYKVVFSHTAFATLADLPQVPDLVIVASPAATVPGVIRAAGARGITSAVVLSAGFAETGAAGAARAGRAAAGGGASGRDAAAGRGSCCCGGGGWATTTRTGGGGGGGGRRSCSSYATSPP